MHSEDRTLQLLERAANGDPDAVAELYRIYESQMVAAVHARLGHTLNGLMESVDLVQSTWKDVLDDLPEFEYRGPDSFHQWLQACLLNKIRAKGRYFAAEKRDPKKLRPLGGEASVEGFGPSLAANDPTPSQIAIGKEDLEQFHRLLERFPEPQRRVLLLRMRDQQSYEEIGEAIGKSTEATRKLYGRALKKLVDLVRAWKGETRG